MRVLIDTVLTYSSDVDVESIIMGLNGALLADAWQYLCEADRENPTDETFVATRRVKEAIVNRADGYSVLATFLRPGVRDSIVSCAARFGLLLLQGSEDPAFSSKHVQLSCLTMERKRMEAHERSIKGNLMALLDKCV